MAWKIIVVKGKKKKKKEKDGFRRDRKQLLVDALQPHSAYKLPKGSGTGVKQSLGKTELLIWLCYTATGCLCCHQVCFYETAPNRRGLCFFALGSHKWNYWVLSELCQIKFPLKVSKLSMESFCYALLNSPNKWQCSLYLWEKALAVCIYSR